MIGFASPMFAKADGPPPVVGPMNPATLFGGAMKGGYYNFTDAASLAINADGTGGVPAVNGACRSVLDLSPNGNRLRNSVASATRRATGVETSGAGYGLYQFAVEGWTNIPQPFEIVACVEQVAFNATDARIVASAASLGLLQGSASGKVRFYDTVYGTEFTPGLATEFVIDGYFDGGSGLVGYNGGAMVASPGAGQSLSGLLLGSDTGGNNRSQVRFKHLLVIGRALTPSERAGVTLWMQS